MGNKHSSQSVENVELVSQSHEPVALHSDCTPLVLSAATKLRVEYISDVLSVLDHKTGELLFRYDEEFFPEWTEKMLMDGKNAPVVMMEKELSYHKNYFIKSRDASHAQLCKIDACKSKSTLDMTLKIKDAKSGEKVVIKIDADRKLRKVVMWVTRGKSPSDAICVISSNSSLSRMNSAEMFDGYDVDVAAGVDLTIVALFCIILHELVTDNVFVSGMAIGAAFG